ncbi:MAG: hemolysin family protein [Gemmatimonadaceae bacterium]|jgi:CBS domain containing-hemolysin-like protein|nr:hemolysin family protein [Gemmatimonadaceae bacterium]
MTPWLWGGVAVITSAIAGASALADGALLGESVVPGSAEAERRERTHRALSIARVASHTIGGVAIGQAFDVGGEGRLVGILQGIASALVVVLLAESIARAVGTVVGARAVQRLAPFARAVDAVFAPITALGRWVDGRLHELLPAPPVDEEQREATTEQFRQVVAAEAEVGRDDKALLFGAFSLGETTVGDIMVPRVDIVGLDLDTPWSEAIDRIRSAQHSRVPVYQDSIDNIVGLLHAKDVLPGVLGDEPPTDWRTLVRPVGIIPATKPVRQQLRDFQTSGAHIAVIVDEYGGTAGLVSLEDILEEIVGEIRDEYDDEERSAERDGEHRFWVSGRLTLDDLSELVGADVRRDDVSTVGGLVYEVLGRVPRAGESLEAIGFRIVVERVVRRKVERVFLERLTPSDTGEDDEA